MSVIEQYAGKRKRDPEVPMPRVVETPKPQLADHAKAVADIQNLVDNNEFLRAENDKLRQDGALALMRVKDLEREAADRSTDLEMYRRYAVEARTHFETMVAVAGHALKCALDAGESAPPPMPDAALKHVADALDKEINANSINGELKPGQATVEKKVEAPAK
jgi:hypothetical protein